MAGRQTIAADPWKKRISNYQLLVAAREGNADVVKVLIEHGADINFQDDNGDTCLHVAAGTNRYKVIEAIFEAPSVNVTVENGEGKTALDMAWETNIEDTCSINKIMEKILERAKEDHVKYDSLLSSKVDKPVNNPTFFDATASGDYTRSYSDEDLQNILTFWCAPLRDEDRDKPMKICITFKVDEARKISLLKGGGVSWSWNEPTKEDIPRFSVPCNSKRSDVVTHVLLEIREVCKELHSMNVGEDYKEKIESMIAQSEKTTTCKCNKRNIFANILRDMERTNDKRRRCLKSLETAKETTFSYKEANILINFFETFACEDTFPEIEMCTAEKVILTTQRKKYYERFYPRGERKKFWDLFSFYRNKLLHKNKGVGIVSPDMIKDFIENELDIKNIKEWYEKLIKFCQFEKNSRKPNKTENDLKKAQEVSKELLDFFEKLRSKSEYFLAPKKNTDEAEESAKSRMIEQVLLNLANWDEPNVRQQVIFDLNVNLFPVLEGEVHHKIKPQLMKLRNKIVHEFLSLSAVDLIVNFHDAVQDLYRYKLAQKVHKVLSALKVRSSLEIEEDLTKALQEQNKESSWNLEPETEVPDTFNSFDSSWMTENRRKLVEIYINYLAPIFHKYDEKIRNDSMTGMSLELNTVQKRKLLEHMWYFRRLCGHSKRLERKELRRTLEQDIEQKLPHLEVTSFMPTVTKAPLKKNDGLVTEILDILKNFDSLQRASTLSQQVITSCYEAFLKGKLHENELSSKNYSMIEETFRHVPNEVREVVFRYPARTAVPVQVRDLVLNLRKIFYEHEKVNQLKMDTIKSVFSDDTFLSYLVNYFKSKETDSWDPNLSWRVVQEVTELKYTSSYVLKLLVVSKNLKVITNSSLKNVLINCLDGYADISCIKELVGLERDRVGCALLEVLKEPRIQKQNVRAVVRILLEAKAECVRSIYEDDRETVLRVASDNLQDLIREQKLDDAQAFIDSTEKLIEIRIDKEWSLYKAELFHERGVLECKPDNALQFFKRALGNLQHVEKRKSRVNYLLACALKARTVQQMYQNCTGKITIENSTEIQQGYKVLLQEIWHYITNDEGKCPDFAEIHKQAESSDRYQDLLAVGEKHRNCFNICSVMLKSEEFYANGTKIPQHFEKPLEAIDAIYNVYRKAIIVRQDMSAICNVCRKQVWQDISNLMLCMEFKIKCHTELAEKSLADNKQYHRWKILELIVLRLEREDNYYREVKRSSIQDLSNMLSRISSHSSLPARPSAAPLPSRQQQPTRPRPQPKPPLNTKVNVFEGKLTAVVIPGDGHCLFSALVHKLRVPSDPQHTGRVMNLRSSVVQHITLQINDRAVRDEWEALLIEAVLASPLRYPVKEENGDEVRPQDHFDAFLEDLRSGEVWGGGETLRAVAELYDVAVRVFYEVGNDSPESVVFQPPGNITEEVGVVYRLSALVQGDIPGQRNHYDSVSEYPPGWIPTDRKEELPENELPETN